MDGHYLILAGTYEALLEIETELSSLHEGILHATTCSLRILIIGGRLAIKHKCLNTRTGKSKKRTKGGENDNRQK